MGYLYETHMHTSQGSACAHVPGAEMARLYKEAGYTGIVITDHFWGGNTAIDRSLEWADWVNGFCEGYEDAKREGDRIGLQVFFGWESGYNATEFLIYGLDKQWLLDHPEIRDCTVEQQRELVRRSGGIVVHAHPFREAPYILEIRLFPAFVDGVEGINVGNRDPQWNEKAIAYAAEHGLPITAGSDQHNGHIAGGGMVFPRKLEDARDLCKAILNSEAIELRDGARPK